mmetsp:Transcript_47450/g.125312  ORF Transcript_47450/g.125312 Transcript_47450/m.125312 type:complete len:201 (-) Transcript_47450:1404-2006(-)
MAWPLSISSSASSPSPSMSKESNNFSICSGELFVQPHCRSPAKNSSRETRRSPFTSKCLIQATNAAPSRSSRKDLSSSKPFMETGLILMLIRPCAEPGASASLSSSDEDRLSESSAMSSFTMDFLCNPAGTPRFSLMLALLAGTPLGDAGGLWVVGVFGSLPCVSAASTALGFDRASRRRRVFISHMVSGLLVERPSASA